MFNKTRDAESQVEPSRSRTSPAETGSQGGPRVASLGPSITIIGQLSGNEELIIEGAVEGEVRVRDHRVTVSRTGKLQADVFGKSICVEGEVNGNLVGDEQVVIRESGRVRGNVTAPRVNLENGAKFKGSIDMQPAKSTSVQGRSPEDLAPGVETKAGRRGGKSSRPAGSKIAGETA